MYQFIISYGADIVKIIIALLILKIMFSVVIKQYHSNWNTLIDHFNYSTQEFYDRLKEELKETKVKNIDFESVSLKIGFSGRRRYLRIEWKEYQYDICGAPFGKGFFISWWLLYKNPIGKIIISKIPFIGKLLANQLYPVTYYRIDTASMFMTYAQSCVLKVIDDITKEKGVRGLTENERKPILNNIFNR